MSQATKHRWEAMRTDESRKVEKALRTAFPHADAYRYNSASIRIRIVDARFKGKSAEERDAMVEPLLKRLPRDIQAQIINLITLAPGELNDCGASSLINVEFEDPSPSML